MKIIADKQSEQYGNSSHPENPDRVRQIYTMLRENGIDTEKATECTEADILRVHTREHVDSVKTGDYYDPDTPHYENIYDMARLSAGAAIQAMQARGMSLMRPPGHHASRDRVAGFCYFNNIAIACERAMKDVGKIAVIDTDGHHGDGTQEIFFGRDDVLFVSLHQIPAYPGSGSQSEKNCRNFPVPPGTAGKEYVQILNSALEEVREFGPDMIAVSAGFDSFSGDPLLQIDLEITDYAVIAGKIKGLGKPTFSVLEGGYSQNLAECVWSFLRGMGYL